MNTHIEIDLDKLKQNIKNLKTLLKPETKFLAVIKSNAYGHGIIEVAKAANEAGANWFGVVNLDEAMALRDANIFKPILILGTVSVQDARQASIQGISIPIYSLEFAREISETYFDKPLKVHLKIDTGLNRLGLENDEISEVVKALKSNSNIMIEGVYSHLASVEESDFDYTKMQIDNLKKAIKIVEELGVKNLIKHLAATAATLLLPAAHFDMVRCGIGVYGLWPSEENKKSYCSSGVENCSDFLQPVLSYKTEIAQIKNVTKGEKIAYGCTYEVKEDMTIGIIPVGYYEGLDRGLSNIGEVLASGIRCPIVGRVAMNMSIIDISKCKNQNAKLWNVTIIGQDGDEEITASEIAAKLGTINYEIVARLPEHIKRIYI